MLITRDQRERKWLVSCEPIEPNVWPLPWLTKVLTRLRAAEEPALGAPRTSGVTVLNSERLRGRPLRLPPVVTKSGWVLLTLARLPRRFRVPPLRATRASPSE